MDEAATWIVAPGSEVWEMTVHSRPNGSHIRYDPARTLAKAVTPLD